MFARIAFITALLSASGEAQAPREAKASGAGAATMAELFKQCDGKDGWGDPAPPVRIHGNSYYVGTCGITAVLITSPAGHVLIDGAVAEGAPHIAANIERLGLRLRDIKLLLATHEHHDHVGGLAELQRRSGASMRASPAATPIMSTGKIPRADPQFGLLEDFPPVKTDKPLRDGEIVKVGPIRLMAHFTPGHAVGGTSWTWRSCEAGRCLNIAFADSVGAASAENYHFSDHPERLAALNSSFATVAKFPCDLLLTGHPSASNLFDRLTGTAPLVDKTACTSYVSAGRKRLADRLAKESAN